MWIDEAINEEALVVLVAVGLTVPDALRVLLVIVKSSYSCCAFISESRTLDVLLPHLLV